MPLDVVRLGDSDLVALSTGDEFKAAVLLWSKSWLQVPAASLPDDDRILAHLSGTGSRWPKLREVALRGWVRCSDGRLYHPVIAEKAADAWKCRLAQRARANKRWSGNSGDGAAEEPRHTPSTPSGNAAASSTAMQGRGKVEGKEKELPSVAVRASKPVLPDWLPMDAWNGYLDMRRRIRKPATDRAIELVIRELTKFRAAGLDVAACLDQSTRSSWVDVYEPKVTTVRPQHQQAGRFAVYDEIAKSRGYNA